MNGCYKKFILFSNKNRMKSFITQTDDGQPPEKSVTKRKFHAVSYSFSLSHFVLLFVKYPAILIFKSECESETVEPTVL